jgi:hypothetical protein
LFQVNTPSCYTSPSPTFPEETMEILLEENRLNSQKSCGPKDHSSRFDIGTAHTYEKR